MSFKICLGSRKERLPLMIIDSYILVSLFLYIFGPVRFHSPYSVFMVMYMLFFLIVINVAYFMGIQKTKYRRTANSEEIEYTNRPVPLWFQITGLVIPLILIILAFMKSGFSGITGSFSNIMAQSYTYVQGGGLSQQGLDIPMWIYMHLAFFVYLSIVDGIVFFSQLSFNRKVMLAGTIVSLLGYFVLFKGTQKTLGDVFVLITSALLIRAYMKKTKRKKMNKKIIFILIILAIFMANTLASILGERINYLGSVGYEAFKLKNEFWTVDLESPLLMFFPKDSRMGYACLVFYLCNGLCGLSYCLGTPFTWSYGIGSIADLSDIIGRRLGLNIFGETYIYKAYETFGWEHSAYWHTIFPWLASDWTFLGALIIMGVIAYIYAICWIEILQGKNKESIFLFSMLNIVWIYLPANNQIMSTRTTALIFVICVYMWIRRKRNVKKKKFFYQQK